MKYSAAGWILVTAFLAVSAAAAADILHVPGDFATIQAALDAALPGDTVEVAGGVYHEKLVFPASGAPGQPIVLRAAAGQGPILDGTGVAGENMVLIDGKSHLRLVGFEIRNHLGVADGSGVRILGSGTDLEIRDNVIHDIRGSDAMGITVYGTESQPISALVIAGNQIYDCDPAQSEALTLNGNVAGFEITGNLVRDVNNIGIDMIGGETDIQPDPGLVARDGVVRGNVVLRANSDYGGGYAGGIYVDGGRDLVLENNLVAESDLGIEIGAENAGLFTENVVVRNNVLHHNERAGLVFGGFESAAGRTRDCEFRGNTLYANNTVGESGQGTYFAGGGVAEIWVQFSEHNTVEGNAVYAGPENVFVGSYDPGSSIDNTFDYNLYWSAGGVEAGEFSNNGTSFDGFADWQSGSGQDAASLAADPLFADAAAADFHLAPESPAVDAGNPAYLPAVGETDLDGQARLAGAAVDVGADELGAGTIFADGFESGDTSAW
jgi:Right handed beta helix region